MFVFPADLSLFVACHVVHGEYDRNIAAIGTKRAHHAFTSSPAGLPIVKPYIGDPADLPEYR